MTEPTEGGGSRTYTAAPEEARAELLAQCATGLDRLSGLFDFVQDREEENARLRRIEQLERELMAAQGEIRAEQPWSAEAASRLRSRVEQLESQSDVLGQDVLSEAFPSAQGGQPDTSEVERRLEQARARLRQQRETLRLVVGAIQGRREAVDAAALGMQLIRALELLDAAVGQDLIVLGGELMGVLGEAGPFVGTSGGTGATVIQIIQDSGLMMELALTDIWTQCIQAELAPPTQCLLLAERVGSNPSGFIADLLVQIETSVQEVTDSVSALGAMRGHASTASE